MKSIITFLIFTCLLGTSAIAGDDAAVFKQYGLMGKHWAVDCSKPVSGSNNYSHYGVSANGTMVEVLQSSQGETIRELHNIQAISAGWLLYTMIDTDKEPINILTRLDGNRMKSWWSVGKDGRAYLVNGRGGANASPWFQKCN